MTYTDVTPGFYGNYKDSATPSPNNLFYPSPSAGTNFPDSTNNIGWAAANLNKFVDPSNIVPGSIGMIKYYHTKPSPFTSTAKFNLEYDVGLLFNEYALW